MTATSTSWSCARRSSTAAEIDPITALHTAARRYCTERYGELQRDHGRLIAEKRAYADKPGGGWTYTDASYAIYPRYNVISAILHDVETTVPADFRTVRAVREMLEAAASAPQSNTHPAAVAAELDERERYATWIARLDPADVPDVPMPYRRVLSSVEADALWERLEARWGRWYGGESDGQAREPVWTVRASEVPDAAYDRLRAALIERGIRRIYELREAAGGFELDVELASFRYETEGFWTSSGVDWLVYASHEDTLTFGGWLVERMQD